MAYFYEIETSEDPLFAESRYHYERHPLKEKFKIKIREIPKSEYEKLDEEQKTIIKNNITFARLAELAGDKKLKELNSIAKEEEKQITFKDNTIREILKKIEMSLQKLLSYGIYFFTSPDITSDDYFYLGLFLLSFALIYSLLIQ